MDQEAPGRCPSKRESLQFWEIPAYNDPSLVDYRDKGKQNEGGTTEQQQRSSLGDTESNATDSKHI